MTHKNKRINIRFLISFFIIIDSKISILIFVSIKVLQNWNISFELAETRASTGYTLWRGFLIINKKRIKKQAVFTLDKLIRKSYYHDKA
jgi:hypothetical protein